MGAPPPSYRPLEVCDERCCPRRTINGWKLVRTTAAFAWIYFGVIWLASVLAP